MVWPALKKVNKLVAIVAQHQNGFYVAFSDTFDTVYDCQNDDCKITRGSLYESHYKCDKDDIDDGKWKCHTLLSADSPQFNAILEKIPKSGNDPASVVQDRFKRVYEGTQKFTKNEYNGDNTLTYLQSFDVHILKEIKEALPQINMLLERDERLGPVLQLDYTDVKQFERGAVTNGDNHCWVNSVLYAFASNMSLVNQYVDCYSADLITFVTNAHFTGVWDARLYNEFLLLAVGSLGESEGVVLPHEAGDSWNAHPIFNYTFNALLSCKTRFRQHHFLLSNVDSAGVQNYRTILKITPETRGTWELVCMVRTASPQPAEVMHRIRNTDLDAEIDVNHWVSFSRLDTGQYRKFDALSGTKDVYLADDCAVSSNQCHWCLAVFLRTD